MDLKTWVTVSKLIGEVERAFEAPISDIKKLLGVEEKSIEGQCSEIFLKEKPIPKKALRSTTFQLLQKLNNGPISINASDSARFIVRTPKESARPYKYYAVELFSSQATRFSERTKIMTAAFAEETEDKKGCAIVVNDLIPIGNPPMKLLLSAIVSHERGHCDLNHYSITDKKWDSVPTPQYLSARAKEKFIAQLNHFLEKKASPDDYKKWIRQDYPKMSQDYVDKLFAWSEEYLTLLHNVENDADLYALLDLSFHRFDPSVYLCGWVFDQFSDLNEDDAKKIEELRKKSQYYPRQQERIAKLKELLPLAKLVYSLQQLFHPATVVN